MLSTEEAEDPKFWAVHSQRSRMIVYEPEPEFYIYAVRPKTLHTSLERADDTAEHRPLPFVRALSAGVRLGNVEDEGGSDLCTWCSGSDRPDAGGWAAEGL